MMNFSYGAVLTGYEKGREEGHDNGLREGLDEGRNENKRNTALKMLKDGRFTVDDVVKFSDLSKEEVEKLKSSL